MTKLLIIGLDAATWRVIKPNLDQLPYFKKLMDEGGYKTIITQDAVLSPAIWCTIFSGKTLAEHGHKKYVVDDKLQTRKDIKVQFVWDILNDKFDIRALQTPFIIPPYNFNCEYKAIGHGVSYDLDELEQDADKLAFKSLEILKQSPDIFIVVFNHLDRLQHFHWGESLILAWYKKMDKILGMLSKYGEKLIIVSDHGFCSRGEAKVQTLPDKNDKGEPLKGDHHEQAILITKNISHPINQHKDIFEAILKEIGHAR